MAVYWITFRIEDDESYDKRYTALMNAVGALVDGPVWEEPTSFWLFQSDSSIAELARAAEGAINPMLDIVLIGSMEHTGATLVGFAENLPELKALVPDLVER